jgi:hypothetical protein
LLIKALFQFEPVFQLLGKRFLGESFYLFKNDVEILTGLFPAQGVFPVPFDIFQVKPDVIGPD